jgi:hypothetical protein
MKWNTMERLAHPGPPAARNAWHGPLSGPHRRALHEQIGAARTEAETFIGRRFSQAFGCSLAAFMPRLFTLRGAEGRIEGALGIRAANDPLFLEQYLDTPVEEELHRCTGQRCERRRIVEVGHLSGSYPGAARTMIGQLAALLHGEGFQWVVFTGTASLRNAFGRMGLAPIEIASARSERLAQHERSTWGSYYQQSPRVFVGDIGAGHQALVRAGMAPLCRAARVS